MEQQDTNHCLDIYEMCSDSCVLDVRDAFQFSFCQQLTVATAAVLTSIYGTQKLNFFCGFRSEMMQQKLQVFFHTDFKTVEEELGNFPTL